MCTYHLFFHWVEFYITTSLTFKAAVMISRDQQVKKHEKLHEFLLGSF